MTSDSTVVPLRRPNTIDDPLTAVLRSGARRLLAQAIEAGLLLGSGVMLGLSRDQTGDQGTEQGFAAPTSVVPELERAEGERQLVLREAPMRAPPGTQQRPEPFQGVGVDLAEAVAVLVAGIRAAPIAGELRSREAGDHARY